MGETVKRRLRTCIGCGLQSDKVELHRIVRSADGRVSFDGTGRAPGRGAYVCSMACLRAASKGKKLQRALRTNVEVGEIERMAAEMQEAMRAEDLG